MYCTKYLFTQSKVQTIQILLLLGGGVLASGAFLARRLTNEARLDARLVSSKAAASSLEVLSRVLSFFEATEIKVKLIFNSVTCRLFYIIYF